MQRKETLAERRFVKRASADCSTTSTVRENQTPWPRQSRTRLTGGECAFVLGGFATMHRNHRHWMLLLIVALIAAACSAADDSSASQVTSDSTAPDVEEQSEEEIANVIPDTAPAIEPGSVASGSVEIDGTTIDYVTSVPAGFSIGDEAPLLLAFPPGGQDIALTQSLVAGTYASEAQRLGWVVISPAAPAGVKYFDGSEALVPGLLDWVETWVSPEGGAPHVAGISNGGISSFRYAAQNPDRVLSVISFPGFPRSTSDQAALSELTNVPIRMYVGETDTSWIQPAKDAVDSFTEAGGDIELTIFPGEGHVMASTADGTVVFEQLESFRPTG